MTPIEERRNEERISVHCEIYCKLQGTKELHEALCVTLSSLGVSFECPRSFEVGSIVEVSVIQEAVMPVLDFFVVVVRCRAIENDQFEIGAVIQMPDVTD